MTSLTFLLSLAPSDLMLGEMSRMRDESDFYVGQELSGQFLSRSRNVSVEKCPPPVEKCLPVEKCPGQEMSVRKWGSKSVRSRIGLTRNCAQLLGSRERLRVNAHQYLASTQTNHVTSLFDKFTHHHM